VKAPETDVEEGRPKQATPSSVWRSRNFRLFFTGQLISNSGTWLQNVAQGVLVLRLSHSNFMVGVTGASLFVPVLLLALAGGRLADLVDRRRLLVGTQVLALAATGTLALLVATGHASTSAVIVVAALIGVQYAISIPAMGALIPALIARDQLGQAIGLNSVTYNAGRVIGPIVSTGAIAGLGFAWAFGINSLSFVALIVALLLLRIERRPRAEPGGSGSVAEALSLAWRNRRLRVMLLGVAAVSIAADPVITLGPAFAHRIFGRSAADAGLVVAAFGVGSIAAAVLLARAFRASSDERLRILRPAMFVFASGLIAFAWIPSFWPAVAALAVGGAGYLASSTAWTTALQEEVAEAMRGRIMGLWTLAFLGTRPLAAIVDGAVADLASPRIGVLVVLAPLVCVALYGVRVLGRTAASEA
jgi:MFS family permease